MSLMRFSSWAIFCSSSRTRASSSSGRRGRDLGIAKLALECREQVHRVAAAVGPGDLAFPLAEEGRILGFEVGVGLAGVPDEVRGSHEDQVGKIDVAQPGLKHEDIIVPVFGIERVRAMAASPLV